MRKKKSEALGEFRWSALNCPPIQSNSQRGAEWPF